MFAVVIGLLFVLLLSVGIVLLVALPHLRHGSRILTPDGERTVKQAQERLTSLAPGRRPGEPEAPEETSGQQPAAGVPGIGRQRPAPVDSGPIPEVEPGAPVAEDEPAPPTRPIQVIDVRETPAAPRGAGQS